jgi:putative salt-induced outer membrane protein
MTAFRKLAILVLLLIAPAATAMAEAPAVTVRLPADIDPTDTLAAMIAAAYRTGDDATINAVVGVAKATFGASRSTGTTRTFGVYASAKLARDGLNWRQKFSGRLDIQQTDNVTTTERVIVAYQPNYKFDERLYSYGLTQYEHDRTLGYDSRFTLGAGLGYTAISTGRAKLEVEGGPAIRHTSFTDEPTTTTLAGRASLTGKIALTPTLTLSQDAALFFEAKDTTITSTSAIESTLIGRLKAKLSYNIQYEQNAPEGSHALDTVTRATLVYGF